MCARERIFTSLLFHSLLSRFQNIYNNEDLVNILIPYFLKRNIHIACINSFGSIAACRYMLYMDFLVLIEAFHLI